MHDAASRMCGGRLLPAVLVVSVVLLLLAVSGCLRPGGQNVLQSEDRLIRVRILQDRQEVALLASAAPVYATAGDPTLRKLDLPAGRTVSVTLAADGWRVGSTAVGAGVLYLRPSPPGSLAVEGVAYRGQYRLVPVGPERFDVVNDVDVDDYLKSVVSRELYWNWHIETYKAQAIVARTYALYEKHVPREPRHWDVHADTRSQVYGGIAAETTRSITAVEETAGVVVAFGPRGEERIFKAYFSSCCGGISQSAADAFGDVWMAPLSDQNVHGLCSASDKFNWGPVVIPKSEVTRRIRLFGQQRNRPEKDIAAVRSIEIEAVNRWGRPVRFLVTDASGTRFSLRGEELRWAINTDAPRGSTLFSSFVKVVNDSDRIHFVEGHGHGHGVGMCQWCAETRARAGMRHEDIVLAAYPAARLIRAY